MAGGLWARKFNYKDGETRICKTCGREWHTMKPRLSCNLCYNEKARLCQIRRKEEGKIEWNKKTKYPYHHGSAQGWKGSAKQHFSNIRNRHDKAWREGKDALREHYDKVFEEIQSNGIWEWIWDRRDRETLDKDRKKRDSKIIKDYPNTKDWNES